MSTNILVSWIGHADLQAATDRSCGAGPIAAALGWEAFDEAYLVSCGEEGLFRPYLAWLEAHTPTRLVHSHAPFSNPTDLRAIWDAARTAAAKARSSSPDANLTFHFSPGTPPMSATWLLLSKTLFRGARLIQSDRSLGVSVVDCPFDIAAELLPELDRRRSGLLDRLATKPELPPAFDQVVRRSAAMQTTVARAMAAATNDFPVLLVGEAGTGKSLIARLIHMTSGRRDGHLITIDCATTPPDVADLELFGLRPWSTIGFSQETSGRIQTADRGTLFLDAIDELPPPVQAKLACVLESRGEVVPLGAKTPDKVDVRFIASTTWEPRLAVAAGRLREDLAQRLGVLTIALPPLREREGDLHPLIASLLADINRRLAGAHPPRTLAPAALNSLAAHTWPGNVRELESTLARAAVFAPESVLTAADIDAALQPPLGRPAPDGLLCRPFPVDLDGILSEVTSHYVQRALSHCGGNATTAAAALGLSEEAFFEKSKGFRSPSAT